jgi:hypothetical protein
MNRLPFAALAIALFLTGCGPSEEKAQQWAATASNTLGTLETQTDKKLAPTVEAFDAAMKELQFLKGEVVLNPTEASLTYRSATTVVSVKLKEFPAYTNIKVRCGVMGEETLSRQILAAVYKEF